MFSPNFGPPKKSSLETKENNETFESFLQSLPRREGGVEVGKMTKIGSGGSHDVFSRSSTDAHVLKINRALLVRVSQIPTVTDEMLAAGRDMVKQKEKEHEAISDAFGAEQCLQEKYFLDKVYSEEAERSIDTVLSIQAKSEVFQNPTKLDFSSPYRDTEASTIPEGEYAELVAMSEGKSFDEATFLKYHEHLAKLFEKIETNESCRKAATDFIENFRTYYAEHQQILDFVGQENVLFYSENEEWKYQVGTVFKGSGTVAEFNEAVLRLEMDPEEFSEAYGKPGILYNTLANARLVNATAAKLDLPPVFEFSLSENAVQNLRKLGVYKITRNGFEKIEESERNEE